MNISNERTYYFQGDSVPFRIKVEFLLFDCVYLRLFWHYTNSEYAIFIDRKLNHSTIILDMHHNRVQTRNPGVTDCAFRHDGVLCHLYNHNCPFPLIKHALYSRKSGHI